MAKHSANILELARKGAQHRYRELKAEMADLVKAFPRLEFGSAVSPYVPKQSYEPVKRRTRRRMSAAQKKAVSQRMKAYWAKRKAGRRKK